MKKNYLVLILAISFIVVGLVGVVASSYMSSYSGFRFGQGRYSSKSYSSNGERIYFTGISKRGVIPLRGGPGWLRMHASGCASCHGEDGHGGLRVMMSDEVTPDITYKALTEEEEGSLDTARDKEEGEEKHPPYDDKLIKQAVTQGLNPAGEPLDWTMPRWNMSDEDFEDVLNFLKELD